MLQFYSKYKSRIIAIAVCLFLVLLILPFATEKRVKRNATYLKKEEVALYLMTYHELPKNYISHYGYEYAKKNGINLEGSVVGGDTHWNTNELANFGVYRDRTLKECDIKGEIYDLSTDKRGSYRLVYTTNEKNIRVFYTEDHYKTFTEIKKFDLQIARNICWIIFAIYTASTITFFVIMTKKTKPPRINTEELTEIHT